MIFNQILIPLIIALLSISVLFAIRSIVFRLLHSWAEKIKTEIGDIIIRAFKTPSVYWCIAIGLYIGIAISEFPEKYVFYISKSVQIIVILSITIATANLSEKIFKNYVQRMGLPVPTTGLAFGVLKGTILIIGMLITLTVLGISITPLITALGVGGLAVALALQDTLANLFAGIHILVEKSIRVGDFIRLETGQEGYVEDITWRTTRIRMMPNNMVIIPNNKLSQSVVTNYHLPEKRMSLSIPISVSYSSDIEKVERILIEEANKSIGEVSGLLGEPIPDAMLVPGFAESSLDFTLSCHIREFADRDSVQHELRKRILRRFREEGIEIPFPQRTVYLKDERNQG
jgi:small-conductance mechanosensitive channel